MSTLKTINVVHPSGTINNIVNDSSGNVTIGNNLTVTGTITSASTTGRLIRAPQILTSGTSYTTPAGCTAIYVEAVGGGGGSGGSNASYGGGGGGGGGGVAKYFTVTASTAYTYAIGAAGTAGSSSGSGGAGGSTTFTVGATTITAGGGSAGVLGSVTVVSASGGTATNGDLNIAGGAAGRSGSSSAYLNELGGQGGNPGLGYFGAGGTLVSATGVGLPGTGYGGGASGATNSGGAGAAGTQGVIRVWEFT